MQLVNRETGEIIYDTEADHTPAPDSAYEVVESGETDHSTPPTAQPTEQGDQAAAQDVQPAQKEREHFKPWHWLVIATLITLVAVTALSLSLAPDNSQPTEHSPAPCVSTAPISAPTDS